jgi:hypothetical protein
MFHRHAHGAGPVAGGLRCAFIEEEDTVLYIAAAEDRLLRRTAGKAPVHALSAMTAESAWYFTLVGPAVRIEQRPGPLRHGASQNSSLLGRRLVSEERLWC